MEGIVSVLKPPAMSSSDVVVDIRKIYGTKRVGHLGTLDPEAAGVLPVCVGRAVRLFDYLVDKQKEYLAEIVFGVSTDTQDAQGRILLRSNETVNKELLLETLPNFTGIFQQTAPLYSALKYNGKKLYDHARSGREVPEKRRFVEIPELSLVEELGRNRFLIRIVCSRGTYIRTLCYDIGASLGIPSHMAFLLRTRSGSFTLENAFTLDELKTMAQNGTIMESLTSCEEALCFLSDLHLDESRMKPTLNGLVTTMTNLPDGSTYRLYAGDVFLGIGKATGGSMRLVVNLYTE